MTRTPIEDDILPLTKPIVGTSGRVYAEIPVPKGTVFTLSAFGYNLYISFTRSPPLLTVALTPFFPYRNQDLWGSDASEFRPERWFKMNEQVESPVGMYGNLYGHTSIPMVLLGIDFPSVQFYILRRCQGLPRVAIRVRWSPFMTFPLPRR